MPCPALSASGGGAISAALKVIDCQTGAAVELAFARLFGPAGALTQALTVALTIYVALFALALLSGRAGLSARMMAPRLLTIGLVLTFVTSWAAYQSVVWQLLTAAPDEVARALLGSGGSATELFASRLDALFAILAQTAQLSAAAPAVAGAAAAPAVMGSAPKPADLLWLSALMLLLGTAGVLIAARIALAAVLAIGPVFIVCGLFGATRGLFAGWLKLAVMLALTPLFAVLLGGGTLALSAPLVAALAVSGGRVSLELAASFALAAFVYLALMLLALRASAMIVSGWRIGGRDRAGRDDAATGPGATALLAGDAAAAAAGSDEARVRQLVRSLAPIAGGAAGAAGDGGPGVIDRRRSTVVAAPDAAAPAPAPVDPGARDPRLRPLGRRFRAPVAAAAVIAALALGHPPAARAEGRIRTLAYGADQIVTVSGTRGIQTMIEFAPDERIENIAVGDSAMWQVTPNKRANLVFLKPLAPGARTNMTVVTDRRRYLFDLRTAPPRALPIYAIRFTYPQERIELPPPPPPPAPKPQPTLNERWIAKGDAKLLPVRVYDDGDSTFMAWAPSAELPAVLAVGADGQEGPVNATMRDGVLVIEGVAPRYVLRIGRAVATLVNGGPPRAAAAAAPGQAGG
ncbi:MAG: TrbG/VirB9 family P-type conjugative transfer protein [Sphingomonadaceae bacterium]|nr:TrbG/VirB9 family P-type conjugative transfer protein [Sphingomonadaceae bacterium]